MERVTRPFGVTNVEKTRRNQGSGMGLPLAIELTRLHGGRCEIHSQPGEGTVVTLWFPAERLVRQAS